MYLDASEATIQISSMLLRGFLCIWHYLVTNNKIQMLSNIDLQVQMLCDTVELNLVECN